MERYTQSETYYPSKQEPDSGVTAIGVGICRLIDGYWWDFNDSTFKNVGWTTKYQALTEDDNGLWLYSTGWAIPDANSAYAIHWQMTDASGTFYAEGHQIVINDAILGATPAQVNAEVLDVINTDATTELATIPTTTGTLRQMVQFLFQYFRNKKTVNATTETLFKEDATTVLGTAALTDDAVIFTKGETN